MEAAAKAWHQRMPGIRVEWSTRPLAAFNDQPIDQIGADYDIVFIDHPAIGDCVEAKSLHPLDVLIAADALVLAAESSIGGSHASYAADGHQWAIAVDVACHVSACRPDLLASAGEAVPETWSDVLALLRRHPGRVAWPLYPSDSILSVMSMPASLLGAHGDLAGLATDQLFDRRAFELMVDALPLLHPLSLAANPPRVLDHMRHTDEVWYVPLTFGYSTYQRTTAGPQLRFGRVPRAGGVPGCSMLGGAGAAILRTARHPKEAAEFLAWLLHHDTRQMLVRHGGQPDGNDLWSDPEADARAGGFFSATLPTLSRSAVRPRHAGWPALQKATGEALATALTAGAAPDAARHAVLSAAAQTSPADLPAQRK
jgi:multiple sugar transport system substrate-binding protein